MAVIDPLKVVIENYPEDAAEELDAVNNPEDASAGTRKVPFSRELWIERDDFAALPPKGFHRLSPGKEVRLRYAYLVTCTGFERDAAGNVTLVRCTYDPATRGGDAPDGRKVRGTLHWVSARHAVEAEVRLYDVLFTVEDPLGEAGDGDFTQTLNPDSLKVLRGCKLEPSLAKATEGQVVQFERLGYFCVDRDARPGAPVWNRAVTLRDTWAKVAAKASAPSR
jgi:glutaminyl-tRNA synthetase